MHLLSLLESELLQGVLLGVMDSVKWEAGARPAYGARSRYSCPGTSVATRCLSHLPEYLGRDLETCRRALSAGEPLSLIARGDADHSWAVRVFRADPDRYITFEVAIAEGDAWRAELLNPPYGAALRELKAAITDSCAQNRRVDILSKQMPKFLIFSRPLVCMGIAFFGGNLPNSYSLSPLNTVPYNDGAIAQLGERLHGMQEVGGSIPPGSTSFDAD